MHGTTTRAGRWAPPGMGRGRCLLLPLLLQGFQEMARAVDLVLMGIGGCGLAIRPATGLGGFPAGQEPRLRFVLPLGMTHEAARELGHRLVPCLLLHDGSRRELNQTTQDWYRSALFENTSLLVSSCPWSCLEATKVTKFVTWHCFTSSSELTGCHRSVRMSCGLI